MPLLETLPVGPDTAQWPLWSTTARIVVTDPGVLATARAVVEARTAAVEEACSRFRADSELSRLPVDGRPVRIGPLLAELVAAALLAAQRTAGDVDPTLGRALSELGYDRDFALIPPRAAVPPGPVVREPAWQRIRLHDGALTVPAGVRLDLGATAKAWTADRCARDVVEHCGGGALVALGGDIATAGEAPAGGWQIRVQDRPEDPAIVVTLAAGGAVATSSTVSRAWTRGGHRVHHVLDPRTGASAAPAWRTVTVAAGSCLEANTLTTAAVVRGLDALPWLRGLGVAARLVGSGAKVVTLGGWPGQVRS
ncbi:FAD:protein FMN transferase [Pseudonocardia acidicola]|uniref:FAD:protein FMN transferase n=1 Tax=Pseudonocardia acidicola TaxID=2724939 RepID=A0ABX1S7Z9_9PSEU|nr:FAD:protein FMN transferase [Pseudonocardia acidicola]NMH97689.1 FAD:protein FMN transferase [Pseudonocardia acidicola]